MPLCRRPWPSRNPESAFGLLAYRLPSLPGGPNFTSTHCSSPRLYRPSSSAITNTPRSSTNFTTSTAHLTALGITYSPQMSKEGRPPDYCASYHPSKNKSEGPQKRLVGLILFDRLANFLKLPILKIRHSYEAKSWQFFSWRSGFKIETEQIPKII